MKKSSIQIFYENQRKIANLNEAMMEMLYGPNSITDNELKKLIEKRPHVYGRFAGYIGKRGK